jgi:hypothetical protein
MLAMIGHKPAPDDAATALAAIVRNRAVDDEDAELLLDALGLNGRELRMNFAPQRFLEPRARRGAGCGEGCATVQGYWRHRSRREATCRESRDAYSAYNRQAAARKREGG